MSAIELTTTPPAEVTAETKLSALLETRACGRCSGTGSFGPMSVMGGRCFKCGGTGRLYTKRGQAALDFYRGLAYTPVEGIAPGDKVRYDGFQAGSLTVPSRWLTVERIVDTAAEAAEAGTYEAALKAAGSCSILKTAEAVEKAAEAGATILPTPRDGEYAVFSGLRIEAVSKTGESFSLGESKGSRKMVPLDRSVKLAILKTVAEYQLTLTKSGTPRKGTRWAE